MQIWNGIMIRDKQDIILDFLYRYRGATNDQLRKYLYANRDSKRSTQLANTSKFVSQLKKDGLIKSASCHPYRPGEINYLTKKGIEYAHDNFEISTTIDEVNLGFHDRLGSFEYDLLKPPLQYIEHHLMFVDVAIKYAGIGSFRHGLYSVKEFKDPLDTGRAVYYKTRKLRPDAELLHKNMVLAVEIDTGSERYDQLVQKFDNYKRFFDSCTREQIKIPYRAILFHTIRGEESIPIEQDRRWLTILKAAIEGLSYYFWEVDILGFHRKSSKFILQEDNEFYHKQKISLPSKENPIQVELNKKLEEQRIEKERAERLVLERDRKKRAEEQKQKEEARRRQLEEERERQLQVEAEEKNKSFINRLFGR